MTLEFYCKNCTELFADREAWMARALEAETLFVVLMNFCKKNGLDGVNLRDLATLFPHGKE